MSDQLAHAYAVCRGIARRSAKNFYYGFIVLPSEKRNAFCAVYAFMRHADDISDGPELSLQEKRTRLDEWLESAKQVFAGKPTDDPVLLALADSQKRFKIPVELFEKLVYGTALDLEIPAPSDSPAVVCRTFEELPKEAQQYVKRIEQLIGAPIKMISVGPERTATLVR